MRAVSIICRGDGVRTALNALAFAPALGDGEKTGNTVRKLATKYPYMARALGHRLSREVPHLVPDDVKRVIWAATLNARENVMIRKLFSKKTPASAFCWRLRGEPHVPGCCAETPLS